MLYLHHEFSGFDGTSRNIPVHFLIRPFPLRDPYPSYPTRRPTATHRETHLSCDRLRLVNGPERGSVADSFWQASVVSVGVCIRGRHRRRAGSYRSRHHRFTRTPCGRNAIHPLSAPACAASLTP